MQLNWCCVCPQWIRTNLYDFLVNLKLAEEEVHLAEANWSAVSKVSENANQLTKTLASLISCQQNHAHHWPQPMVRDNTMHQAVICEFQCNTALMGAQTVECTRAKLWQWLYYADQCNELTGYQSMRYLHFVQKSQITHDALWIIQCSLNYRQ